MEVMAGSAILSCHRILGPKKIITEYIEDFSNYNFDILVITDILYYFNLLNVIYINQ